MIFIIYRSCFLIGLLISCTSATAVDIISPLEASKIFAKMSGDIPANLRKGLVKYYIYNDSVGEHILFVRKNSTQSITRPRKDQISRQEISVKSYLFGSNSPLQFEWAIFDANDCPGLDSETDYFVDKISIMDVNGDGKAEVTIPYYMFCSGGIDPISIKIIMRNGSEKFAIRGESKVVYSGQESFGGNHAIDSSLNSPKNLKFKMHMLSIWDAVVVDKR